MGKPPGKDWLHDPRIVTALWAGVVFFGGIVFNDIRASAKTVEEHSVELAEQKMAIKSYDGIKSQVQSIQIDTSILKSQQAYQEKKLDEILRRLK